MLVSGAILTSLALSAPAAGESLEATAQKFNGVLCRTEDQAVALASIAASGKTEPIAIDLVNKQEGAQVCGRYIGFAVLEVEKTENHHGGLFMLAGFRFVEDQALAWTASWITPFNGAKLSRGA